MPRVQEVGKNRGACTYCMTTTKGRCRTCGPICWACERVFHGRWQKVVHCKDRPLECLPQCQSERRAYAHNQKIINQPWTSGATSTTPTGAPSSPDGTGLGRIVGSVAAGLPGPNDTSLAGASSAPDASATTACQSTSSIQRLSTLAYPPAARLLSWRLNHSLYEPQPRKKTRKTAPGATAKQRSRSKKLREVSFSEQDCDDSQDCDSP